MKIKYVSGPRAGQFDRAPNSQETQLLASAGIIEIIPYKSFQERLADEQAHRAQSNPPVTVDWGVHQSETSRAKILVVKKTASEVLYFDAPPKDCPPQVRERWQKAVNLERALQNDQPRIDRDKREHAVQQEREKSFKHY